MRATNSSSASSSGAKVGKEVDQALRYDLTVPLARVIAMNPALPLPFRRYQVEPVWRADRPQKGRFRQFLQCDVDIVGTESELAEAECLAVVDASLSALGFDDHVIRLNDRRILRGMAAEVGAADREVSLITAIQARQDRARRRCTGIEGSGLR